MRLVSCHKLHKVGHLSEASWGCSVVISYMRLVSCQKDHGIGQLSLDMYIGLVSCHKLKEVGQLT